MGHIFVLLWAQKARRFSASGGVRPPDPLTRGSAPGPRWGLRPQTPIIGLIPGSAPGLSGSHISRTRNSHVLDESWLTGAPSHDHYLRWEPGSPCFPEMDPVAQPVSAQF